MSGQGEFRESTLRRMTAIVESSEDEEDFEAEGKSHHGEPESQTLRVENHIDHDYYSPPDDTVSSPLVGIQA